MKVETEPSPIDLSELKPERWYWAQAKDGERVEIVFVSTIFGLDMEYWTIARIGTDQHAMLEDFIFLSEVRPYPLRDAR